MRRVLAEWPSPVVFCGREVGEAVKYPGAAIATDFDWPPAHPVVDYYTAAEEDALYTPAQDVVAALHAIRPKADIFQASETGTIEVLDSGQLQFKPDPAGKHVRLAIDPAKKDAALASVREVLHYKPVAPPQRRRPSPEEIEKLRKEREEEQKKRELEEKKAVPAATPAATTP